MLTGGLVHTELALFELLGAKAPACADDGVASFLAAAALAHAWRAEQLAELLPVSLGLPDAAACTLSPGRTAEEALAVLAGGERDDGQGTEDGDGGESGERGQGTEGGEVLVAASLELLAAVVGPLYAALEAAYTARLARCGEAAEQALRRVLGRVLADLGAVRAAGEALLSCLEGRPSAVARPAGPSARLRALFEEDEAPFGVAVTVPGARSPGR